jgi:hypothetical protein
MSEEEKELLDYLNKHPVLSKSLSEILKTVSSHLSNDWKVIKLKIFKSYDLADEYLTINCRKASYQPNSGMDEIDKANKAIDSILEGLDGYVLVTTDFIKS